MLGLVHTAVVYTPNTTNGDYTVVDNAALACRLTLVSPDTAQDARDRAELAAARRLLWGPDYVMPETARVSIASLDSPNWNVVPGTFAEVSGLGGALVYRRCECVRAE